MSDNVEHTTNTPKHWQVKTLGEVLDRATSNISLKKIDNDNGEFPVFGAKGFIKNISSFQQKDETLAIIKDGAGIGRVYKLPRYSSILATMQFLIPKNINIDFARYLLKTIDFEKEYKTGSTIPHIYYKDYKNREIFTPPLNEQKNIVKKLDAILEDISKAKQNTKQNIQNAKDLFTSTLNQVFNNPNNNWQEKTLGEVLNIERGGSPRPINKYLTEDKNGINWVKISDATKSDKYIYTTKQKIIKEGLTKTKLVKENDFLLSNSMSFGKPYIMKTQGCVHDGWLILRNNNIVEMEQDFLYYLLSSPYIFKQFDYLATGSTVRNLNISLVSSVKIKIPPLTEQQQIITKLSAMETHTQELEKHYQNQLKLLEELEKSVLQKAFSGELI